MESTASLAPAVPGLSLDDCELGVPELLARVVRQSPGAIALRAPGIEFTYDELNRAANRLAQALLNAGVKRGEVVAVGVESPAQLGISLLAVLKAGGVLVFLDLKSPPSRLREILADSGARIVVTDGPGAGPDADSPLAGMEVLSVDSAALAGFSDLDPELLPVSDSLMALYYTSGTTSRPKGICRSQKQAIFEARVFVRAFDIQGHDRLLMPVSFTFGASTRYALGAWLTGAMLCPVAVEVTGLATLVRFAQETRITHLYATPSLFRHFCRAAMEASAGDALHAVLLTGEPVRGSDVQLARDWMGSRPWRLLNSLGSTECGAYCHLLVTPSLRLEDDVLPVGLPVEGKEVLIVDEHRVPLPRGQTGEIAVRSAYLAQGYWKRPDLDAQSFRADPDHAGERIFYTGDLGYQDERGWIRLVGRRDFQIKVRGYRVEPGEIEAILGRHPAIRHAVVLPATSDKGSTILVAYLQRATPGAVPGRREMDRFLLDHLPPYMLPARFLVLDEFPLTERGKIDRNALPHTKAEPLEQSRDRSEVADPLVQELCHIWAGLLGSAPRDIHAGFFESGGDSLLAIHFLARVRARWGMAVPVAIFYQAPTVEAVARWIAAEAVFGPDSAVFPMNDMVDGLPDLYFLPGWMRHTLELRPLARRLSGRFNCFGLELPPGGSTAETIEDLAAHCVRIIATRKPSRPLYLAGFSMGGLMAFEVGRQLSVGGTPVARVFILDTSVNMLRPAPGWPRRRRFLWNALRHPLRAGQRVWEFACHKVLALGGWTSSRRHVDHLMPSNFGPMPHREAASRYVPGKSHLHLTLCITWERRLQLASGDEPWPSCTDQPVRWVQMPVSVHHDLVKPPHDEALAAVIVPDPEPGPGGNGGAARPPDSSPR